jgi:hypothetical protein
MVFRLLTRLARWRAIGSGQVRSADADHRHDDCSGCRDADRTAGKYLPQAGAARIPRGVPPR